MKKIGLIGGLSWESTAVYYKFINQFVKERLGGLHSAKCLLYSFDFEEIVQMQFNGEWEKATQSMVEAAETLQKGGAEMIVICTNTMHKMADDIEQAVNLPLLHIVDATGEAIKEKGLKKAGLLGTRFTMEQPFYRDRLKEMGIEVIIPKEGDRARVHEIIYEELCVGEFKPSSKEEYLKIINTLHNEGAEGIILGCTEIPLLIAQDDTNIPLFDTTLIHARAVADFALKEEKISVIK